MSIRIRMFGIALLLLFTLPPPHAVAEGESLDEKVVRTQLDQLQVEKVESFWKELKKEYGRFFPEKQGDLFDLVLSKGEKGFSWKGLIRGFSKYFFHEVLYNARLLGTIIVLTVFSMILRTLQTAFERNQVSKIAYAIVFMVIIILAVDSFSVAVDAAKEAISRMLHFMLALLPLVLTLLASMGNVGSVGIFHPLIVLMIHLIGTLIHTIVFPVLFFSAILGIVSCLSDKYKVNQPCQSFQKDRRWIDGHLVDRFFGNCIRARSNSSRG